MIIFNEINVYIVIVSSIKKTEKLSVIVILTFILTTRLPGKLYRVNRFNLVLGISKEEIYKKT